MKAGIYKATNEEYHADTECVGHSMIETWRHSIPEYHDRYIDKTIKDKQTDSKRLGSLVHLMILEPGKIGEGFAVEPEVNRRTNAGKAELKEFHEANPGKLLVTADDMEKSAEIVNSVFSTPKAKALLEQPGRSEINCRVEHASGVWAKARFDKLLDVGTVLDLKSSKRPTPAGFSKDVWDYGIHRQAAIYLYVRTRGLQLDGPIYHIAVGNTPPYECVVYEIQREAIYRGKEEIDKALHEIASHRKENDWGSRWQDVQEVSLPAWAWKE